MSTGATRHPSVFLYADLTGNASGAEPDLRLWEDKVQLVKWQCKFGGGGASQFLQKPNRQGDEPDG